MDQSIASGNIRCDNLGHRVDCRGISGTLLKDLSSTADRTAFLVIAHSHETSASQVLRKDFFVLNRMEEQNIGQQFFVRQHCRQGSGRQGCKGSIVWSKYSPGTLA